MVVRMVNGRTETDRGQYGQNGRNGQNGQNGQWSGGVVLQRVNEEMELQPAGGGLVSQADELLRLLGV
jgi:hypothetical protein